jgi:hypothetical protein
VSQFGDEGCEVFAFLFGCGSAIGNGGAVGDGPGYGDCGGVGIGRGLDVGCHDISGNGDFDIQLNITCIMGRSRAVESAK